MLVSAWFTPPEGDGARLDECPVRNRATLMALRTKESQMCHVVPTHEESWITCRCRPADNVEHWTDRGGRNGYLHRDLHRRARKG